MGWKGTRGAALALAALRLPGGRQREQLCSQATGDPTDEGCANCLRCQPQRSSFRARDRALTPTARSAAISLPPGRTGGAKSRGHTKAEEPNFFFELRKITLVLLTSGSGLCHEHLREAFVSPTVAVS